MVSGRHGLEEKGEEEEGLASKSLSVTRVNKPACLNPKLLLPARLPTRYSVLTVPSWVWGLQPKLTPDLAPCPSLMLLGQEVGAGDKVPWEPV